MNGKEHLDLEAAIRDALDRHLKRADGETPPNLAESIRYSLLAPGKRIRPRLSLACAQMLELPLPAALSAAVALEMIHCFTLIHDDLPCMDDDDFRRGRPSNHKVFGEAIALLAGDGLIALATDTLLDAEAHIEPRHLLAGLKRLSWAMGPRAVIGGQAAEVLLNEKSTVEEMRFMHAQKTGALFAAALLIPKDFAGIGSDSEKGQAIDEFAKQLGLAFQVADDFEDAEQDVGKPRSILFYMSESEARQATYDDLKAATSSLLKLWGKPASSLAAIADEVLKKVEP